MSSLFKSTLRQCSWFSPSLTFPCLVLSCLSLSLSLTSFWLSVSRPGNCPILQPPQFCIADYDECQIDTDCFPGKKCCNNSCFKRCVNPTFDQVGSGKLRNSPVIILRHRNVWCMVSSSGVDRANYNLTRPHTEHQADLKLRSRLSLNCTTQES